ncbi:DUF3253 domain-containing protein [Xanthomonas campestris pv. raphani]|uniref:DUF3253 domain-containing protein n=1 Tax=Xanthomonas campestris TaxID=339 RepID=UPI002B2272CE|nr:DUF3253 domain-containing protein [Xanthomonas campestris]MEA9748121.1 DUF3253 domain-containing protein [Xanthomonas campestris pv. raphani]MEA9848901.1 DUF3253 domain-containing protein [Xanthomonas campestris pv. raphani]MEA9931176.1 DUF3253 domain-containing protein [Xanthomonas campestris pv. raphani]
MQVPDAAQMAALIVDLLARREPQHSICPSDVARAISEDAAIWRALMPQVRATAVALVGEGVVRITQRGQPVELGTARGPIRLMRGPRFPR